jgi:hypothetical protein
MKVYYFEDKSGHLHMLQAWETHNAVLLQAFSNTNQGTYLSLVTAWSQLVQKPA